MISIDTDKMEVARRLNGTSINGCPGYYGKTCCDGDCYFIIAIPRDQASIIRLMRDIECEE